MARADADPDLPIGEMETVAKAVRERFEMDLHDGLGQELAGLSMLASALADQLVGVKSVDAPAATRVAALTRQALASARSMAAGLDSVAPGGLGEALRGLCDSSRGVSPGVSVRVHIGPVAPSQARRR